jgi:murein DD-endopeptidase MepM/ murein hydrolase activator NlpD
VGLLSEIVVSDGVKARLAPELNAGTVALQSYFVNSYDSVGWLKALDVQTGLPALHERMFGNAWLRAQTVEPLFPPELTQPHLTLPFFIGQLWSYTGGPHGAWERDGARAALDFSPARTESGCVESDAWVIAAAPGIVTRSGHGVLVTDLDGDGHEQTGWVLVYLHLKMPNAIKPGTLVEAGDLLGHPSCEGGISTGTHLHIARKYNGEWMPAAGPVPFVMGGWTPHAGEKPYAGTLTREGELITASPVGSFESRITRGQDDP